MKNVVIIYFCSFSINTQTVQWGIVLLWLRDRIGDYVNEIVQSYKLGYSPYHISWQNNLKPLHSTSGEAYDNDDDVTDLVLNDSTAGKKALIFWEKGDYDGIVSALQGEPGPQGVCGKRGLTGEKSEQGPEGKRGKDSPEGERGEHGPEGKHGKDGSECKCGKDGREVKCGEQDHPSFWMIINCTK